MLYITIFITLFYKRRPNLSKSFFEESSTVAIQLHLNMGVGFGEYVATNYRTYLRLSMSVVGIKLVVACSNIHQTCILQLLSLAWTIILFVCLLSLTLSECVSFARFIVVVVAVVTIWKHKLNNYCSNMFQQLSPPIPNEQQNLPPGHLTTSFWYFFYNTFGRGGGSGGCRGAVTVVVTISVPLFLLSMIVHGLTTRCPVVRHFLDVRWRITFLTVATSWKLEEVHTLLKSWIDVFFLFVWNNFLVLIRNLYKRMWFFFSLSANKWAGPFSRN